MERRQASKRGYTFVEMIVVVTVLVLVSAAIAPTLTSMKATSDHRSVVSAVHRIVPYARERAIQQGMTTQIVYDDSAHELQVQDVASDGTATTSVHQAVMDLEPQAYQMEGRDATASDFKLTFTPDGKSNGGGIEFKDFSISVDQNGICHFNDGALPPAGDDSWQAGDLEQRQ